MNQIRVQQTAVIDAPPEEVYAILADYHQDHPAILPAPFFTSLTVEEGGTGAGTIIGLRMQVLGIERTYRMVISEPEPGRVLQETDAEAGVVTTFTVEPLHEGQQTRVTILTESRPSPGLTGILERWFNPLITRYIYRKELQQLTDLIRHRSGAAPDA